MKEKKLTFSESLMLVAGAGIGTGILTIPYAIEKIGIWGTLAALILAYAASAALYFIIADLTRNSKKPDDLIAILDEHLFGKKGKKILSILFFLLLILLLLENLVVYVLCAGEVLEDLLGIHGILAKILFYVLAFPVLAFGVKGMGMGEKISVGLIGGVVALLTILSCLDMKGTLDTGFGDPTLAFAVYGLFMFAFSAIFSIIQVCNHIEKPTLAGKAILGGLTLNAMITVVFSLAAIWGSETITEIATIGLSEGIGIPGVKVLCSILVLFAMFTSFWSSGMAFADVIEGRLHLPAPSARLIATAPALLVAVFLPLTVLDYVQIGAGALSVILVMVVLPAYYNAMQKAQKPPLLGKLAKSKLLISLVAVAILLMAISSFVPIR